MTKTERETIQKVCDYFDYHNKNLTRKQWAMIDDLKELVENWVAHYTKMGQTEAAAAARAKYWKKYKKTHKAHIKAYSHQYYQAKKARKLATSKK